MDELGFLLSAALQAHDRRPALCISGQEISYRDLDEWSRRLASHLRGQVIGIISGGSLETYAGVLAVVRSDRTYVPLNADFPDDRLLQTITDTNIESLIVDRQHIDRALGLLRHHPKTLRILTLEAEPDTRALAMARRHDLVAVKASPLPKPDEVNIETSGETPLYIMSTSGSTGTPKKIAIPRRQVVDYLTSIRDLFDFTPEDRFSHFFKLSFDLSVHDLLVTWSVGASLYVPGPSDLLDPVAFARRNALTVWFSVPSLLGLAIMSRKLKADTLPAIRHGIFCGEVLSWEAADAFRAAAPNAGISNLYGPTEATIAITHYAVGRERTPSKERLSSVPIGHPFRGQEALVVGPDLDILPAGERGELLLGGSQLAPGYIGDPAQTEQAFVERQFPGFHSRRWYRTGDIVVAATDGLVFLGRCDSQVKFRGFRVELGEIEAVLQRVARTPLAIVIAWPPFASGPIDRLLAFVMPPHDPTEELHAMMRDQLPAHMVPARILTINQPVAAILNDNQKIDRAKIARIYQDRLG